MKRNDSWPTSPQSLFGPGNTHCHPLKLWARTASTAIPKFKNRSHHSVYAPIAYFAAVESMLTKFKVVSYSRYENNEICKI